MDSHEFLRTARQVARVTRPFTLIWVALIALIAFAFSLYFASTQWRFFFAGILIAVLLLEVTRLSRAKLTAMRRTEQLLKSKLEYEILAHKLSKEQLAESQARLRLIDEVLPIMVVLVDIEGLCRYHNRAFLEWLHLRPSQVTGRHLREVFGAKVYHEIAAANRKSLEGHVVQYEHTQTMPDGALYKLAVQHLPQFSADGKVTGFYMLLTDITKPADVRTAAKAVQFVSTIPPSASVQNLFIDSFSEQMIGEKEAANRIMHAIEKGEFRLFCQQIRPLSPHPDHVAHHEILIRLVEEEESLMPPGAFFPLAEKYGLMPHLDRWVVRHLVAWLAEHPQEAGAMFFINIADATIADVGFPEFLQCLLLEHGVSGSRLCFEIPDAELSVHATQVADFVHRIRQSDCQIALSGFGRVRVLFDQINGFHIEFLKIDGSIVLEILRDPVALAKASAIHRVAKEIGVQTIAEFVEHEDIISKLAELGIDFAQGFGISQPCPLDDLAPDTPI